MHMLKAAIGIKLLQVVASDWQVHFNDRRRKRRERIKPTSWLQCFNQYKRNAKIGEFPNSQEVLKEEWLKLLNGFGSCWSRLYRLDKKKKNVFFSYLSLNIFHSRFSTSLITFGDMPASDASVVSVFKFPIHLFIACDAFCCLWHHTVTRFSNFVLSSLVKFASSSSEPLDLSLCHADIFSFRWSFHRYTNTMSGSGCSNNAAFQCLCVAQKKHSINVSGWRCSHGFPWTFSQIWFIFTGGRSEALPTETRGWYILFKTLITDHHGPVRKYMPTERENTNHYFDVFRVAKTFGEYNHHGRPFSWAYKNACNNYFTAKPPAIFVFIFSNW